MGDCLKVIDMGKPSPLWVAPFPKQELLNCVREDEIKLSTSKRVSK